MPANSLSDTIRYVRDPAALEANGAKRLPYIIDQHGLTVTES